MKSYNYNKNSNNNLKFQRFRQFWFGTRRTIGGEGKYKCAYCDFVNESIEAIHNHILDEHTYVEVVGDNLVVTFNADVDKPDKDVKESK